MHTKFVRLGMTMLLVLMLSTALVGTASAVSGAVSTTDNPGYVGPGTYVNQACLNGQGTNCNIYEDKRDVWFSGLPVSAALGAGTYFFAVVEPGGQGGNANPNDGTAKNLSDDYDAYGNRSFTVDGNGNITSYAGDHEQDGNLLQLFPYADTSNPGGVYILAVCSLDGNLDPQQFGEPGVDPSDCKYDAFKVQEEETPPGLPLTITKDANGAYDNTYTWTITKDVDKTTVKQIGGSATFNYTVTVTHDAGTISNVTVTGTITVFNPNVDANNNTIPVDIDGVTDTLSDGTACDVTNGGAQTLTQAETHFAYSCDLTGLPQGELDNTATVTWSEQFLENGALLTDGSADFTFKGISFAENTIDECVNVSDSYAGTLGTVCVGDANPTTFNYSRTIAIPQYDCQSYDNTATFTTNDTGATGSASQTVTVCGPAKTGALTIGFWKNTNGNSLIQNYCAPGGKPSLATYLSTLGGALNNGPFKDAAGKSCSQLVTYVNGILSGASATDMNKMLKAQMLASALDVYFSSPAMGYTTTAAGKIKPPSNFLSGNSLGSFNMDTTAVCPMVDNTTTGSATCKLGLPSTDAVASGAVPSSPMSMQAILDYAATSPAPFNAGVWYSGNRTKQEILKNIFDQFNNQLAFGSF